MSEAIAAEVEALGINVVIVEPGPFRTDMRRRSLETSAQRIADYPDYGSDLRQADGVQDGDPRLAARAIIAAVQSSRPPLRLVLGRSALDTVRRKVARLEDDLTAWERATIATAFGGDDELARALAE
jgi:NAD(P)-dependent dehydrogenase (short-subunit alcohol dehydrogenase family)